MSRFYFAKMLKYLASVNQENPELTKRSTKMQTSKLKSKFKQVDFIDLGLKLCIGLVVLTLLYLFFKSDEVKGPKAGQQVIKNKKVEFYDPELDRMSNHRFNEVCVEGVVYFMPRARGGSLSAKWKKDGTIATCE